VDAISMLPRGGPIMWVLLALFVLLPLLVASLTVLAARGRRVPALAWWGGPLLCLLIGVLGSFLSYGAALDAVDVAEIIHPEGSNGLLHSTLWVGPVPWISSALLAAALLALSSVGLGLGVWVHTRQHPRGPWVTVAAMGSSPLWGGLLFLLAGIRAGVGRETTWLFLVTPFLVLVAVALGLVLASWRRPQDPTHELWAIGHRVTLLVLGLGAGLLVCAGLWGMARAGVHQAYAHVSLDTQQAKLLSAQVQGSYVGGVAVVLASCWLALGLAALAPSGLGVVRVVRPRSVATTMLLVAIVACSLGALWKHEASIAKRTTEVMLAGLGERETDLPVPTMWESSECSSVAGVPFPTMVTWRNGGWRAWGADGLGERLALPLPVDGAHHITVIVSADVSANRLTETDLFADDGAPGEHVIALLLRACDPASDRPPWLQGTDYGAIRLEWMPSSTPVVDHAAVDAAYRETLADIQRSVSEDYEHNGVLGEPAYPEREDFYPRNLYILDDGHEVQIWLDDDLLVRHEGLEDALAEARAADHFQGLRQAVLVPGDLWTIQDLVSTCLVAGRAIDSGGGAWHSPPVCGLRRHFPGGE